MIKMYLMQPTPLLWQLLHITKFKLISVLSLLFCISISYPGFIYWQLTQHNAIATHSQQQLSQQLTQQQQMTEKLQQRIKLHYQQNNLSARIVEMQHHLLKLQDKFNLVLDSQWATFEAAQVDVQVNLPFSHLYQIWTVLMQNLPTGWQVEQIQITKNEDKYRTLQVKLRLVWQH